MPSRKPLWPLLAVAMLSLTGCATPVSDACPPIVSYPPAVSQRLADEIAAAGRQRHPDGDRGLHPRAGHAAGVPVRGAASRGQVEEARAEAGEGLRPFSFGRRIGEAKIGRAHV